MDSDLKSKIKSDLETFLKSKQYYHRLGRLWKRSYLLYGPSGTGKSTFVAGMAKFLGYDVYDIDLCRVSDDSDLKMLLLQTKSKSVIVIEDLDRHLLAKSTGPTLSGILNFMDGIFSCCGEERVMVFTMTTGKDQIDPTVLRPGRVDVHVHFPLCDFNAFKSLANTHLGLKDHKLFSHVEDIFQTGAKRVMVFTMTTGKDQIDPTVLRPGRVDVHVHFPLCDFNAFKSLANTHLGLKDHKLFSHVEDIFQTGASLSPAEIGEIMISNRASPNRALKSVISALQTNSEERTAARHTQRLTHIESGRANDDLGEKGIFGKEGIKEARKFMIANVMDTLETLPSPSEIPRQIHRHDQIR
ncbi:unnamed protein product [Cuscuta campestris]|uniref:AAA+ ATPase domain-containing protein n=1 Tax=Cuscuta campestris TaxID=132261 RepID=A0A484NDX2_9ASTE|nr:unnamed protein product [Cuscuta campestris]